MPELLERERATGSRSRSTSDDVAGCEFLFVCVDTPPTYSGDADLSRVWTVVDELPELEGRPILVMKSTVPVGTGEKVRAGLDAARARARRLRLEPRVPRRGHARSSDFMHPDRIVVGAFEAERRRRGRRRCTRRSTRRSCAADVNSAEMIKLAANAFLMTRISFINEIANVCEATGADVVKVAEGVGLDQRLGPHFLRAGIGYGGSCFPKDSLALKQLASNSGYHFQLLSAVIEVNELQKRRVIGKLKRHLGALRGKTVALLGLAFKAEHRRHARGAVDRARVAPARRGRRGARLGPGRRRRRKLPNGVEIVGSRRSRRSRGADAAVIVTEWAELKRARVARRSARRWRHPLIVDGRNLLDPEDDARGRASPTRASAGRPRRPTCCRDPERRPPSST